jgi:periodic tryptophan protein 1
MSRKDAEMMMGGVECDDDDDDDDDDKNDVVGDAYESSDSEDEDDLDDVPDTREYMPLDVEGLQSLGIGGSGGGDGGGKMHGKDGGYTMEDLQNMTMNDDDVDEDEDDDDDDQEDEDDIQLRNTDALIVVAKTEEDFASLEVNVFDTQSSNLYVHHDIPLPSYPLCLALGSVVTSDANDGTARAGNYVAVGSFEPAIEVWNLDVMNALEPTLVLGGMDTRDAEEGWMRIQQQAMKSSSSTIGGGRTTNAKTKKTKNGGGRGGRGRSGLREGSHTDAVMGLSWNAVHRQVLASASADCTVKLWDVTQAHGDYIRPSATLSHHTDKVQSLAWHPVEGTLLATGGYDRRVCLVDARSASSVSTANNNSNQSVKTAKLLADCEALAWDPHNGQYLTAASEDGTVQCWDVRKFGSDPVWRFVAHEYGGVSDITYNACVLNTAFFLHFCHQPKDHPLIIIHFVHPQYTLGTVKYQECLSPALSTKW